MSDYPGGIRPFPAGDVTSIMRLRRLFRERRNMLANLVVGSAHAPRHILPLGSVMNSIVYLVGLVVVVLVVLSFFGLR
jgi:hypothetical protein